MRKGCFFWCCVFIKKILPMCVCIVYFVFLRPIVNRVQYVVSSILERMFYSLFYFLFRVFVWSHIILWAPLVWFLPGFFKRRLNYVFEIINDRWNDVVEEYGYAKMRERYARYTHLYYSSQRYGQSVSSKEDSASLKEEDSKKIDSLFNVFLDGYRGTYTSGDGVSESGESNSDWFSVACESVGGSDKASGDGVSESGESNSDWFSVACESVGGSDKA